MTAEDRLLCLCSTQHFTTERSQAALRISREGPIRWDSLCATAKRHAIAPLVFFNLQKDAELYALVPDETRTAFTKCLLKNKFVKQHRSRELDRVVSDCEGLDIDVLLIKGAALDAVAYERPWYTVAADIDLMIRDRHGAAPAEKMQAIAWHIECSGPFECEYFKHHDVDINGLLRIDFARIWQEAVQVDLRGRAVFVMSPEDLLLTACINGSRRRFVRLKNLLDIAEAARRVPADRWAKFVAAANASDCQNIVYAAIKATKLTVGCDIPDDVLRELHVGTWRAAVINQVIRRALTFSFDQLDAGITVFWKCITVSLVIPYATYTSRQLCGALWMTLQDRLILLKQWLSKPLLKKARKGAQVHSSLEVSR
jgi:hypothetical protein